METAIKNDIDKKEYFDEPKVLEEKVNQLAQLILASNHFCAFTGAGLSTAAGIPDFRSGYDTVNAVGPGAWEIRAKEHEAKQQGKKTPVNKATKKVTMSKAHPTKAHMSMVELMNKGYLKHVISQNTDGLHRKSGVPADKISEVHGNTNKEECMKCGKEYMRDFRVRNAQKTHEHKTGRKCDDPKCRGDLKDTIINFNENLREDILNMGFAHGYESDLMLAVGSSLRVEPAASMAGACTQRGGNLVIINLQKTPMDNQATIRIYGRCQVVFEMLMKKLNIAIPEWNIKRHLKIELQERMNKEYLTVSGVDTNNCPYDYLKSVKINDEAKSAVVIKDSQKNANADYFVTCEFQGHYNEPRLNMSIPRKLLDQAKGCIRVDMIYNPVKRQWEFVMSYDFHSKNDLDIIKFK